MKKVIAICVYKRNFDNMTYQMYDLTVHHKTNLINLVHYDKDSKVAPYKYSLFYDMYESILNLLKQNDSYVSDWKDFGCKWYDIAFIDVDTYKITHYLQSAIKQNTHKKVKRESFREKRVKLKRESKI